MVTATESESALVVQSEQTAITEADIGNNVRASWNVSLDELQKNISHSSEEAQELFTWCFLWCIDEAHAMRLEEFALQVHSDKTTIQRIIRGSYFHPETKVRMPIGEKLVKAMKKFRELEQERMRQARKGFVMTPTARRIWTACDLARESRSPVFLIGPSHIGKTWSLVEYKETHNHGHTVYVRLNAASGLMGMIRAIAASLGISDKAATPALIGRIKTVLKKRPNILLIFDEVHQLMYTYRKQSFFACLEVLREIYDETGVGFVLCGTELLFKNIKDNRSDLEQLLRRGVHRVVLPDQPTRGDVEAIVQNLGMQMPGKNETLTVKINGVDILETPFAILKQIGKEEGLKAITERLRYAGKFARKEEKKLGWQHFVRAHLTIKENASTEDDWN
jgi:DNA transposition AAA+ family ATPase